MTKLRDPLSPAATVKLVADTIGWARACAIVGRRERAVRNWSDPDVVARISFDAAFVLDREFMARGGGFAPFLSLAYATLLTADGRIPGCDTARAERAADAAEEAGEALAAQIRANLPGASHRDLAEARRETSEAIVAFARLLPDLEPRRAA
jgi:hypothetical protein